MEQFIFVSKIFLATVVIVFLMQIQVGNHTIETHLDQALKSSAITAPLRETSHATVLVLEKGYRSTKNWISNAMPNSLVEKKAAFKGRFSGVFERSSAAKKIEEEKQLKKQAKKERDEENKESNDSADDESFD